MVLKKEQINASIGILSIIILFLLASYLIESNLGSVKILLEAGIYSKVSYILILIISTVIAPVSAIPLLPIASLTWGWFLTGILSLIGWTIGAIIAFIISRKYGIPLVKKLVSLKDFEKYEKLIPTNNYFWSIVFLRIAVPVDILSYILGLFSHIKFRVYVLATIIGTIPLAFVFAYLGTIGFKYQIMSFLVAVIIVLMGYSIKKGYGRYKGRKILLNENLVSEKEIKHDPI